MVGFLFLIIQPFILRFSSCNEIRDFKLVLIGKSDVYPQGSVIATSVLQNIYTCAVSCNVTSPCSSVSFKKVSAAGQGTCMLYEGSIVLGPSPHILPFPWFTYEFDGQVRFTNQNQSRQNQTFELRILDLTTAHTRPSGIDHLNLNVHLIGTLANRSFSISFIFMDNLPCGYLTIV